MKESNSKIKGVYKSYAEYKLTFYCPSIVRNKFGVDERETLTAFKEWIAKWRGKISCIEYEEQIYEDDICSNEITFENPLDAQDCLSSFSETFSDSEYWVGEFNSESPDSKMDSLVEFIPFNLDDRVIVELTDEGQRKTGCEQKRLSLKLISLIEYLGDYQDPIDFCSPDIQLMVGKKLSDDEIEELFPLAQSGDES